MFDRNNGTWTEVQSLRRKYDDSGGGGWTLVYIFCFILCVLYLYFSCQSGSGLSTCSTGLQLNDICGLVCCSPVYLLYLLLKSGGLKFW